MVSYVCFPLMTLWIQTSLLHVFIPCLLSVFLLLILTRMVLGYLVCVGGHIYWRFFFVFLIFPLPSCLFYICAYLRMQ